MQQVDLIANGKLEPGTKTPTSYSCLYRFQKLVYNLYFPQLKLVEDKFSIQQWDFLLNVKRKLQQSLQDPEMAFTRCCLRKPQQNLSSVEEDTKLNRSQLKEFSWQELQVATGNFKNILGRDGYGPFGKVYKGVLEDGSLVAIKRMKSEHTPGREAQFLKVMEMIAIAEHPNLLKLCGFCITSTERLLVYPYMANGSVASHLRDQCPSQPSLDWSIRKQIALVSAKVLSYLHEQCNPRIVHCDIKAASILLDEDYEAYIGDFTLSKLINYNDTHITSTVHGTIGYIAPEYLSNGRCSEKIDVYSYGIMLLELITGQKGYDLSRLSNDDDNVMLLDWVKGFVKENKLEMLIDPNLRNNYVEGEMEQLMQVALLCTHDLHEYRPKMSEVVRMVQSVGLAERWDKWQKMQISDKHIGPILNPACAFVEIVDSTHNLQVVELSGPR